MTALGFSEGGERQCVEARLRSAFARRSRSARFALCTLAGSSSASVSLAAGETLGFLAKHNCDDHLLRGRAHSDQPRCYSGGHVETLRITPHLSPHAANRLGTVLASWNSGLAKQAIVDLVEGVSEDGPGFVRPVDRIATFDYDGTLWCEKPTYVQAGLLPQANEGNRSRPSPRWLKISRTRR